MPAQGQASWLVLPDLQFGFHGHQAPVEGIVLVDLLGQLHNPVLDLPHPVVDKMALLPQGQDRPDQRPQGRDQGDQDAQMAITNDYWSYVIWHQLRDGEDFDKDYVKMVDEISSADIQKLAADILRQNHRIEVTMLSAK